MPSSYQLTQLDAPLRKTVNYFIRFGAGEAANWFRAKPCRQNALFFHESCWEALTALVQEKRYGRPDPHDVLAIEELKWFARDLLKPSPKMQKSKTRNIPGTATATAIHDCFSRCPVEIREAIAVDLLTPATFSLACPLAESLKSSI